MTRTILIVDDEAHLRMLIQQTLEELEDEGVELLTASNGEEALAAIEAVKPNLVFLDVMMPKLSGFDVCQRAKHELGLTRRLHRPAHRQGPGVRPPEGAGGRRRPLHDQALRSRRPAREGPRRARPVSAPMSACRPEAGDRAVRARRAPWSTRWSAALGAAVAIEDADGRLLYGERSER